MRRSAWWPRGRVRSRPVPTSAVHQPSCAGIAPSPSRVRSSASNAAISGPVATAFDRASARGDSRHARSRVDCVAEGRPSERRRNRRAVAATTIVVGCASATGLRRTSGREAVARRRHESCSGRPVRSAPRSSRGHRPSRPRARRPVRLHPAKVGVDAGALVGRPPTGVLATNDKAAILALDADVVFHAASKAFPENTNTDDIVALLESGKNVITTTSYNHLPTYGADVDRRIRAACDRRRHPVPRRRRAPRLHVRTPRGVGHRAVATGRPHHGAGVRRLLRGGGRGDARRPHGHGEAARGHHHRVADVPRHLGAVRAGDRCDRDGARAGARRDPPLGRDRRRRSRRRGGVRHAARRLGRRPDHVVERVPRWRSRCSWRRSTGPPPTTSRAGTSTSRRRSSCASGSRASHRSRLDLTIDNQLDGELAGHVRRSARGGDDGGARAARRPGRAAGRRDRAGVRRLPLADRTRRPDARGWAS